MILLKIKTIYVPLSGVGKTGIITRFLNGSYRETYVATTEDTYK